MIKRILNIAILGAAIINFTACNSKKGGDYKKTADGLEYQILKDEKTGTAPGDNDLVTVKVRVYYNEKDKKDTLIADYVKMNGGEPFELPANVPLAFKSDWPSGLKLMTPGDSAIFRTPVDTLMKLGQGQLPPFMKKGGYILYSVVLVSVKNVGEMKAAEDKTLQDYFAKNSLSPTKTPTGMYYMIDKEGTGDVAKQGQTVVVNYTGKLLDGTTFDSNIDPKFQHVEPLSFQLGGGQVIPGWDEGVGYLKKGSKAKLFIPSQLAYGAQARPGLPANSILMFDVEVLDIKEGGGTMPEMDMSGKK